MPGRLFTVTAGDHGLRAPLPGDQNLNVREPLVRGLLSAWIFNHASDRYVPDIGPVGCNINTLTTPTAGMGVGKIVHPSGAGYHFQTAANGSSGTTLTGPAKELHSNLTSGPLSIVLRVYPSTGPGGPALMFGKAIAGSVSTGWGLIFDDVALTFQFWIGCVTTEFKAVAPALPALDRWYDIAIVYNGSTAASPATSQCQFYINGGAVANGASSQNGSGAINSDAAMTMNFGGDGSTNFLSAHCAIAHAYIFNRLLTDGDVKSITETPYAICALPANRRWFSIANSSSTANTQTLTLTAAALATLTKQPGLIKSPPASGVVSIVKRAQVVKSVTTTAIASLFKQAQQPLSTSATGSATRTTQANQPLLVTVATVLALVKTPGKLLALTVSAAVTLAKQAQKTLSLTASAIVTFVAIKVVLQTLSIVVGTSLSLTKQAQKAYGLTVATVISVTKQTQKAFRLTATVLVTLTSIKVVLQTLSVTVGTSITRIAQTRAIRSLTSLVVVPYAKTANAIRTTLAPVASLTRTKQAQLVKTVTATPIVTTPTRQPRNVYSVAVTVAPTLSKSVRAIRSLVTSVIVSLSRFIPGQTSPRVIRLTAITNTTNNVLAFRSTTQNWTSRPTSPAALAGRVNSPDTLVGIASTTQNWTAA